MTETIRPATTDAAPTAKRSSMRWGQLNGWLVVARFLGTSGWRLGQSGQGRVATGLAPDFTLTTFDGERMRLNDRRGPAVVVNFPWQRPPGQGWASWCVPCRTKSPRLEAAWRDYRDWGVVFVGVAYLDDNAAGRHFVTEFTAPIPTARTWARVSPRCTASTATPKRSLWTSPNNCAGYMSVPGRKPNCVSASRRYWWRER